MATILERFDKKEPHYPVVYEDSIMKRFSEKAAYDQGGLRSEEEIFGGGRFFSRYYECFMYAAMIGIKAEYKLPFDRNKEGKKFLPIEGWKPRKMTLYIFMGLLSLANANFENLEELNDEQLDQKAYDLMVLLEQYAHGGFDLIHKKIKENPHSFDSPFSLVNFMKSIKPNDN